MKGAGVLRAIARGNTNPLDLLPPLLEAMPSSSKLPLLELLELVGGARRVGPSDPPPWAAVLFLEAGEALGLSPDLLAALSCVLAGYRPDHRTPDRSGLLGTPAALLEGGTAAAELGELADRSPSAIAAVRFGVVATARFIVARRRAGGLVSALLEYLKAGGSLFATDDLERVLWTYLVLLARRTQGGKLEALQEVTGGG